MGGGGGGGGGGRREASRAHTLSPLEPEAKGLRFLTRVGNPVSFTHAFLPAHRALPHRAGPAPGVRRLRQRAEHPARLPELPVRLLRRPQRGAGARARAARALRRRARRHGERRVAHGPRLLGGKGPPRRPRRRDHTQVRPRLPARQHHLRGLPHRRPDPEPRGGDAGRHVPPRRPPSPHTQLPRLRAAADRGVQAGAEAVQGRPASRVGKPARGRRGGRGRECRTTWPPPPASWSCADSR